MKIEFNRVPEQQFTSPVTENRGGISKPFSVDVLAGEDTSFSQKFWHACQKLVSYIKYLFFCSCFHKKAPVDVNALEKTEKKELKESLTKLKASFIQWREEDKSADQAEFRKKWHAHFQSLPYKVREYLILEDIKLLAVRKASLDEGERAKWVIDRYADKHQHELSEKFVAGLEVEINRGIKFDPIYDQFVPTMIQRVIDSIVL